MAKRGKPISKSQKLQRDYTRYRKQVIETVQKWEEAGYTVPKSLLVPKVPKTVKQETVKKLKTILSKKAQSTVVSETREELRKARGIRKSQSYKYTDKMFQQDLAVRAEERRKEKEQNTERIQPPESKNHATQQILENVIKTIKDRIKEYSDYDPYDVFKFLTESFAAYKSNAVSKIVSWFQDTLDYLDDYLDGEDIPENVISYAAYIENNAELLHSLADKVAYDSGGKDHIEDINNMNDIQEILMGGKLGASQKVTINDIMGA